MLKTNPRLSAATPSVSYWEERARRYAREGEGLRAVCSYGMPTFYNRAIQFCQRLALEPWIRRVAHAEVLDVGCGVGRWSCWMAARGARVTGVDISPTMVREARRRAAARGLADRCRFTVQDLVELNTGRLYSLILGVTVLQHILDPQRLRRAVGKLAAHLAPRGRLVLLEASPSQPEPRCDSVVFRARPLRSYLGLFAESGLVVETVTGVDPAPLKTMFLPHYPRLAKPLALMGLAAVTVLSLPVDALLGRRWVQPSWHKVFVLKRRRGA